MKEQRVAQILEGIAEDAVPATLDLWPAIRAQVQPRRRSSRWARIVLATANLAALSKDRITLRKRLLAGKTFPAHQRTTWAAKAAAASALLLLVVVAAFAASPPLRTWAQEVLARVGNMIVTDAPTDAEQMLPGLLTATPEWVEGPSPESLSQEEASRRVGFAVLVPRDIPKGEDIYAPPGGAPWEDKWDICAVRNEALVVGIYNRWYGVRILQLRLTDEQSEDLAIGDADIVAVTVRGQTGYWIEEATTSMTLLSVVGSLKVPDPDWQLANENILTWEEEGIVFVIYGDDELSQDELLTIAESLAP